MVILTVDMVIVIVICDYLYDAIAVELAVTWL
jgi:hypothetical protein